ncbi:MAG: hypothetical protein ABL949_15220 [Fimbriimonadaceae bacterium]
MKSMFTALIPIALQQGGSQAVTSPLPILPPVSAPAQTANTFAPLSIKDTNRLALTPVLDGKLDVEEWEALTSDTYFQWEPGRLHFAGIANTGQDLVASFDLAGNGWLVGSDNLEVTVRKSSAGAEVVCRFLDATSPAGPTWIDAPELRAAARVASSSQGASWTAEVTLSDSANSVFPEKSESKVGVRVEAATGMANAQPYMPRNLTMMNLTMDRGTQLPVGLQWKPEFRGRSVTAGEDIRIRLTFNGIDGMNFKRVEMRTEGLAKNDTAVKGYPFPEFDRKMRTFVDYDTPVAVGAKPGWRIMRATIMDSQDRPITVQTSYEVAPTIQFDFDRKTNVVSSTESQKVRFATYIRSNTKRRVTGQFSVKPPPGWTVESGSDKMFVIYNSRASKRQVFELNVPAGFKGVAPLTLTAQIGDSTIEEQVWLRVP